VFMFVGCIAKDEDRLMKDPRSTMKSLAQLHMAESWTRGPNGWKTTL